MRKALSLAMKFRDVGKNKLAIELQVTPEMAKRIINKGFKTTEKFAVKIRLANFVFETLLTVLNQARYAKEVQRDEDAYERLLGQYCELLWFCHHGDFPLSLSTCMEHDYELEANQLSGAAIKHDWARLTKIPRTHDAELAKRTLAKFRRENRTLDQTPYRPRERRF